MKKQLFFICIAISLLGFSFSARADLNIPDTEIREDLSTEPTEQMLYKTGNRIRYNIVAVVNDDAISDYDLANRIAFVMETSNIPDTEENRSHIKEQILNMMIDEKLKKQEATRNGISNTVKEIDDAVATIEKQNGLPAGALPAKIESMGISEDTLREQIDADLLWVKNSHMTLGERIKVSDEEIQYRLERIKESSDKNQYLLADILLPIEDEEKESEVYGTAMQILESLHSGSSFSNLARQFSASMTAGAGGDMGWVAEGSLEKELDEAAKRLSVGQVSLPIKTASGYHLLLVRDKKYAGGNKLLELAKITLPKTYQAHNPDYEEKLKQPFASCESFINLGKDIFAEGAGNLGEVPLTALPEDVQDILRNLPDLKPSAPLVGEEKDAYFMICRHTDEGTSSTELPSLEQIRRMIETERLDVLARRKLRELRSSAILEKRN